MTIFANTSLFFMRKVRESLRQPVWLLSGLASPLMYTLLFAPLLMNMGPESCTMAQVLDGFVPGILTLLAFSTGMGAGWTVIHELDTGVIERLRVSPASRFSILMGGVLNDTLFFLITAILVLGAVAMFGFTLHLAGIAVMLALLGLLTGAISAASNSLGMILKHVGSIAAVVTSLQLPLTLLSGVLIPISSGPVWLQNLAKINPMYYTVQASRLLCAGTIASGDVGMAFAVTVALTVLSIAWASRVYRKAVA